MWKPGSLVAPSARDPWPGRGEETFLRILDVGSHCAVITKPVGEVLTGPRLNGRIWKCNSGWD